MKEGLLVKSVGGVLIAGITYFLGGLDQVLQILLWMIIIDYATGILSGMVNKELSSKIGFRGICKKIMILIVVVVAVQIDKMLGQTKFVRLAIISFYISNEAISILENAAKIGLPIPSFFVNMLKLIKDQADQGKVTDRKEVG